jgi:ATP-dependent Lon protease
MDGSKKLDVPLLVPVLPVRNTVLFPNAAVPLIVGRPKSISAIRTAQSTGDLLLVITQIDGAKEEPLHSELYSVGVICHISKVTQMESDNFQLVANGLFRFQIREFVDMPGYLAARGQQMVENPSHENPRAQALSAEIKQLGRAILALTAVPGADAISKLFSQMADPGQVADLCSTFLNLPVAAKQELLEQENIEKRLAVLLNHMTREKDRLVLQNDIQAKMMERLSKDQRDHLLREQLKTIHDELGDETNSTEDLNKRIEKAEMSDEAKKVAKEELSRLNLVQRSSPEYNVIRTYLDWLICLPWKKCSGLEGSQIDLKKAKTILEEDHFGIEKVKKRILQFLAVNKLKGDMKGPMLCLLGPPGVGKTSMGRSIANAVGRQFVRASLGGIRDEAEIRGHRRTYVGAMPGKLIQSMKRSGVKDPVILLDEIDKVGMDFRGDPASALLEVLDPEQNHTFSDHYIDVPFDLSRVFFITTANVAENIPAALRDRMEMIEMTSYSKAEKMQIAIRHLVPKLINEHGLNIKQFIISNQSLETVIDGYTMEAGVRNLNRELAHLCRAAAELLAQDLVSQIEISPERVEEFLGPARFFVQEIAKRARPGIVTGLAWTPMGGEILNIEVTRMEGKGALILTGKLGDIMKESARIALSLVRGSIGSQLPFRFDKSDFHIHVPSGAIPKDGPSAGVAIYLALNSLVENKVIDPSLAVTGEITLSGNILPVGGVKEKIIAAHRAGVKSVLLPDRNRGDVKDVSEDVRQQLKFHFVKETDDALQLAGLGRLSPPILMREHEHLIQN